MKKTNAIDPNYDPITWKIWDNKGENSADRKFPDPKTIYPEIEDFARVDPSCYVDKAGMTREWDQMWSRTWTCAGRLSDLPVPGSFFRYDLGKESFIIVRGHDNEVRALYNVCQHRGRRIVDQDMGRMVQFVCPFHTWAYDLKGKNVRVTDREVFSERALCGELDLKPVRCESWAGFVFITMNPDAPPLLDFLGPIPQLMAAYKMEDMYVVKDVVLSMNCNWKVAVEAFIEAYHLHVTHPQAMPATEDYYAQFDIFPNGHSRHVSPVATPSVRLNDRETVNPLLQFLMADAGMDPATFKGKGTDVRAAIQEFKRRPDNHFGLDYSQFTSSQIVDDWNYLLFPNMTFNTHPEGVLIMRFLPHPTDPETFYYHVHVIMPKLKDGCKAPFYFGIEDATDISGKTRPKRVRSSKENPGLGEVLEQDIRNIEAVQQGLQSRGFPSGMRYAAHEIRLQVLHAELERYLKAQK